MDEFRDGRNYGSKASVERSPLTHDPITACGTFQQQLYAHALADMDQGGSTIICFGCVVPFE